MQWAVDRYVHALAPRLFSQKELGVTLQRAAFRTSDLLPVYGSSELVHERPFRATEMFARYPTGFAIFPVGDRGTPLLVTVQALAGVGETMRGKKVVIFVSYQSLVSPRGQRGTYRRYFARLHAVELAFNSHLGTAFKRRAAERMIEKRQTLQQDPLLELALEQLVDGSPFSRIGYYAILPLGKLEGLVMRLQDEAQLALYLIRNAPATHVMSRQRESFDWPALALLAEQQYRSEATGNAFGFADSFWQRASAWIMSTKESESDSAFLRKMSQAKAWADFELLLWELREFGADALVIGMPLPGKWYEFMGVSYAARRAYYQRLRKLAEAYGVAIVVPEEHDDDIYFNFDAYGHPSQKGWIYYDQVLDSFYHQDTR